MSALTGLMNENVAVAVVVLALSFFILARCADLFVDSAVALAARFHIPKMVIGIILVSLATTTPELTVSLLAALSNQPQMALGNALGSVACNLGLALALCALFAPREIRICPGVRRLSGGFMLLSMIVCTVAVALQRTETVAGSGGAVVHMHSLTRIAGLILLTIYVIYATLLLKQHRSEKDDADLRAEVEITAHESKRPLPRVLVAFLTALVGIVFCSRLIVTAATAVALRANIPEAVIALTLVALGTSIPEIATCVSAARRGHGEVAVGNVIGANILNICWVAGGSAIANDLTITRREAAFMFPSVFLLVIASLLLVRHGNVINKHDGIILLAMYGAYIALFGFMFMG